MTNKHRVYEILKDYIFIVAGSILFAAATDIFTVPNNFAPGGATGISIMLHRFFGKIPVGTLILLVNIPLFIWGLFRAGYRFVLKSGIAMVISSLFIDILQPYLAVYSGDKVLSSLFGGAISGLGLGLIFLRGATTGGSDLTASLIAMNVRHLSMGRLILIIDLTVATASALVFRNIETSLYSALMIFVSSAVIDKVVYGSYGGKMIFIISKKGRQIADEILRRTGRGVTILKSIGAYTGENSEVLMCAVRRYELYKLLDIASTIDQESFIISGEASDIRGEGFLRTELGA